MLLLVVPLVLGHEEDWPLWGWVSLAASVPMFAISVLVERSIARRGGSPLVSGRVLRAPGLLIGCGALFVAMVNYGGYLFAMALHLQSGLGEGGARAGLVFAPAAIGFAVTGLTWRRLPERWHGAVIPFGLAAAALGYLLLAPILHAGSHGGAVLELDLLVIGLALGLAFAILTVALRHMPLADAAEASGVLVTVFQLGQVFGVASLGTTYLSLVRGPGAQASAHAIVTTLVALALSALLAAGLALVLARKRAVAIG